MLLLAGIGVYGLLTGPRTTTDTYGDPDPVPTLTTPHGRQAPAPTLLPVKASDDPEEFARNVATALFTWDTGTGFMPLDYQAVILDVGDPSGTEQAGLATDVADYLPSREAWTDLRQYATTQHLTIEDASVPRSGVMRSHRRSRGSCPRARRRSRSRAPGTAKVSGTTNPSPPSTRSPSPCSSSAPRPTTPATCCAYRSSTIPSAESWPGHTVKEVDASW